MVINSYNVAMAITPSDTDDLPLYQANGLLTNAIHVGTAGTDADVVEAVMQDGSVVSFTVVAGEVLPIAVRRINETNTTASNLVALYIQ